MLDTFNSAPVILGYTPRSVFIPFHARRQRWACMITHRRAGKTVGCIRDMIDKAVRKPGGRFAYVAPLRNQAKTVAWDYLKDFARPILAKPPNEAELYVEVRTAGSATARITLYSAFPLSTGPGGRPPFCAFARLAASAAGVILLR